ncbi:hypothetical protein I3842_10G160400 [Carya illinoinensis]|uniref:Uncharacterized protein n=1 Tax=Carya illinoinensis TaxID=32201 RepID=A0A922J3R8_CARIL|nr:hypothetical protein I3842_10G160400 [Carya illinoinensis]
MFSYGKVKRKFCRFSDEYMFNLLRQAKDVMKAVKKRLQHKNPKVQLLSLTLLETMVKNCGDNVHFQVAEKKILEEMIKIVKKKADMQVREKILVLIDSWQEAFGGSGGKHPQYYMAYEELRHSGVEFPQRSLDAAPIFTLPVNHPTLRLSQARYGRMPSNSSRRLDETMATEIESLSLSDMDSMRNVMELLSDMLQAVNPNDRAALRDEVIIDLVNRCRSNQKKLMQMLTTTGDEELLGQGLELNDSLQSSLAKHDAIASGSPLPALAANSSPKSTEVCASNTKPSVALSSSPRPNAVQPVLTITRAPIDEEEEEEDEFAQLARRHSKTQPKTFQSTGTNEALSSMNTSTSITSLLAASTSGPHTALALHDLPAPVRSTKEQDMIDLLSITLSTMSASPHTPPAFNQNMNEVPIFPSAQRYLSAPQTYAGNQGQVSNNSYVVPWAQPQLQPQLQPQGFQQVRHQPQSFQQVLPQPQSSQHVQPQSFQQVQPQPQLKSQSRPQMQTHYQYPPYYPPPPWAPTLVCSNNQNHESTTPQANKTASYTPMRETRPLQHYNSFPSAGVNGYDMYGDPRGSAGPRNPAATPAPAAGPKSFVPSYRLFEDLDVFGNVASGSTPSSLSGSSGHSMVGWRE